MITFTQLPSAALDEAAAILEAEWMRLQRQSAARAEDHFTDPAESPVPHRFPPTIAIGDACVRKRSPPGGEVRNPLRQKSLRA